MQSLTVGCIGLGLMGMPMSMNILKKGFPLVVYNRTKGKTKELEKRGVTIAVSPEDLAKQVAVVITMVTAGKDVEHVLFGKNGVVKGAKKGLIVIDMSTIGPTKAREIGEKLAKFDVDFLDAPVTGSTPKAKTGELTIFIGGKKTVFEKVKNVLSAMGTELHYMGETGSGQAIKLINNHIIASSVLPVAEGLFLADAMKLDRKRVARVLETVPAMSGFMKLKLPNFVSGKYPLLFSVANMKKDLTLALLESKKSKHQFPVLSMVEKLYQRALREGLSKEDMSMVATLLERK